MSEERSHDRSSGRIDGQTRDGAREAASRAGSSGGHEPPPSPEQAATALRELAELVEERIPAGYRGEAFRALARWRLGQPVAEPAGGRAVAAPPAAAAAVRSRATEGTARPGRLDLSPFASILAGSGRMLQKALVALEVSRSQLGIDWLTPAEIERFLIERARVRTAYRTNISNALSGARHLVDRRRRGRGYEYRITAPGRELLEREVRLGSDA